VTAASYEHGGINSPVMVSQVCDDVLGGAGVDAYRFLWSTVPDLSPSDLSPGIST
jgi:hypothetical protein